MCGIRTHSKSDDTRSTNHIACTNCLVPDLSERVYIISFKVNIIQDAIIIQCINWQCNSYTGSFIKYLYFFYRII